MRNTKRDIQTKETERENWSIESMRWKLFTENTEVGRNRDIKDRERDTTEKNKEEDDTG